MADIVIPKVPEIVTVVADFTFLVLTVKVALVAPEATVTVVATLATLFWAVRVTTAPPAGAVAFSVTVPVEELPPVTMVGFREMEVTNNVMLYVPLATALLLKPTAVAMALIVVVLLTAIAPLYTVEEVVGVLPSVV